MANPTLAILAAYQRNRTIVWVAVLVIALSVFIYFKGKKDGNTIIKDANFPDEGGLASGFNPNILADKLYEVMNGLFTMTGTKDAAWKELIAESMTNNMLTSVYNTYNKKYGKFGKGTLTQWIKDEAYYDALSGVREKVLARLSQLRLN